jgi:hypothetical protein
MIPSIIGKFCGITDKFFLTVAASICRLAIIGGWYQRPGFTFPFWRVRLADDWIL